MSVEYRKEFLTLVDTLVNGDRNSQYGEPIDDFECTATMLTAFFKHMLKDDVVIEPWHVPAIQIMVKLSRIRTSPDKEDHPADMAGYATTLADVRPCRVNPPQEGEVDQAKVDCAKAEFLTFFRQNGALDG